jgi:hypothetical protein
MTWARQVLAILAPAPQGLSSTALHYSHCDTPMNVGNIDVLPGPGMAVAAAG